MKDYNNLANLDRGCTHRKTQGKFRCRTKWCVYESGWKLDWLSFICLKMLTFACLYFIILLITRMFVNICIFRLVKRWTTFDKIWCERSCHPGLHVSNFIFKSCTVWSSQLCYSFDAWCNNRHTHLKAVILLWLYVKIRWMF